MIPHLGMGMPANDGWVAERLRELQRQISELRAARTLEAATIGAGGITVQNAGAVVLSDTNGTTISSTGALPTGYNRPDGSRQPGVAHYREDGSLAVLLGDANPMLPPYKQAFQVFDRSGNVIVADDTNSGKGLGVPYIPVGPLANTNVSTWPSTTAASYTTILDGFIPQQHPGFQWTIMLQADASTTGVFRLTVNGLTIATSSSVTNTIVQWNGTYYYPAGWTFGSYAEVTIDAQRTAGSGTIRAQVYLLIGVAS